jgi:protein-arginine kinase activator protein McsA
MGRTVDIAVICHHCASRTATARISDGGSQFVVTVLQCWTASIDNQRGDLELAIEYTCPDCNRMLLRILGRHWRKFKCSTCGLTVYCNDKTRKFYHRLPACEHYSRLYNQLETPKE